MKKVIMMVCCSFDFDYYFVQIFTLHKKTKKKKKKKNQVPKMYTWVCVAEWSALRTTLATKMKQNKKNQKQKKKKKGD